jgi:hypothetical protein
VRGHFEAGVDRGSTDADIVQKTAEFHRLYNALWDAVETKKVSQYEFAYRLVRLNRQWDSDLKNGFAGSSELSRHLKTTCPKCGNPIGFDYKLSAKVENKMPT